MFKEGDSSKTQKIDGCFLCRLGLVVLENCTRKENRLSDPCRKSMTKMKRLNASKRYFLFSSSSFLFLQIIMKYSSFLTIRNMPSRPVDLIFDSIKL